MGRVLDNVCLSVIACYSTKGHVTKAPSKFIPDSG